jgi:hypothetical protein
MSGHDGEVFVSCASIGASFWLGYSHPLRFALSKVGGGLGFVVEGIADLSYDI